MSKELSTERLHTIFIEAAKVRELSDGERYRRGELTNNRVLPVSHATLTHFKMVDMISADERVVNRSIVFSVKGFMDDDDPSKEARFIVMIDEDGFVRALQAGKPGVHRVTNSNGPMLEVR